jgi:predicted amidohydrolase YtcJ
MRGAIFAGVFVVTTFVVGSSALAAPDTIIVNAKVLTADPKFSVAEAIAIENGRFAEVGTSAHIRTLAGPQTKVIDAGGRTVIPGLIDNHTHLIRASRNWWREARLDGVATRKEALEIIKRRAAAAKPGQWILVLGGWSEDQFSDEKKGFTRAELDAAAPNNPVFAQVLFARAYANSKALDAAGIAKGSPEPKSGTVERTAEGEPTGILRGAGAIALVSAVAAKQTEDRAVEGLKAVMTDLNRVGITTVLDVGGFGLTDRDYEPVRMLNTKGALSVRFYRTLWTPSQNPEQAKASIEKIRALKPFTGDAFFDLVGVGETLYRPAHDNLFGPPSVKPEHIPIMKELMQAVAESRLYLHLHAQYDESIGMFLDAIEDINKTTPIGPLRWTFAHVDRIGSANVERLKKLGISVALHSRPSIQARMLANRHKEAALKMPPVKTLSESGLLWGLGSDTTIVAPFSPFITLAWAVSGKMLDGSAALSDTVSREQALVGHTRNNALLIGKGDQLGSIERGKLADLVMLDRDYLSAAIDDIRRLQPVLTMVGGKVVYEGK